MSVDADLGPLAEVECVSFLHRSYRSPASTVGRQRDMTRQRAREDRGAGLRLLQGEGAASVIGESAWKSYRLSPVEVFTPSFIGIGVGS